jgi:beta-1,4-mannosyl-glycoprotein beta-1,4-N-acetylglucosaminyltransferase
LAEFLDSLNLLSTVASQKHALSVINKIYIEGFALQSLERTFTTYDCFTFDGEDCLDLRLRAHWDQIDVFVIVEANVTFSGLSKEYSFNADHYSWALQKIRYFKVAAEEFKDCTTAWERETLQRNALQRGYQDAKPNDVIVIGDVDEIFKPDTICGIDENTFHRFQQLTFYFYCDYLLVSDPFWEKVVAVRAEFALTTTP